MADIDERELLDVAQAAARAAADQLRARFGQRQAGVRAKSGPTDLVSDADLAAESAIRKVLAEHRPEDALLAEESGASGDADGEGRLLWIVDPLDGTINFLFGIPQFAVSIAVSQAGRTLAGVVLDPMREECFAASSSGVPTLNGEPIHGSQRAELATAMIATGFGYDSRVRAGQAEVLTRVLPRVRDIRRAGAAALDLAWCACGRYDAYYERGLHAWDLAAGALIAERAGLQVRDLPENEDEPPGAIVAPDALMEQLYGLVAG